MQKKDTDRHVAPRKNVQINQKAHEKALKIQRALEAQMGVKVTFGSVIEWSIEQASQKVTQQEQAE